MTASCQASSLISSRNFLTDEVDSYQHVGHKSTVDTRPPKVVMMAGCPGSGKTFVANFLSQEFGWESLNKDSLKRKYLAEFNVANMSNCPEKEQLIDKAGRNAFDDVFRLTSQKINEGSSIIVDSCGYLPFILKDIHESLAKQEFCLKIVLCDATMTIRQQRLAKRGSEFKEYNIPLPDIVDDDQAKEFFKDLPGDKHKLDTNVTFTSLDLIFLRKKFDDLIRYINE